MLCSGFGSRPVVFRLIQSCKGQQTQQAAVFWSVRFRDMLMLALGPPMYLLLPLCGLRWSSNVLYSSWESVELSRQQ